MPRQATIRDPEGNAVATLTIPDDATPDQINEKIAAVKQQAMTRQPAAATTTTPTTRTVPQALGETARAFGRRTMAGEQALEESLRAGDVRGIARGTVQGIFPALPGALPMMASGAGLETLVRIAPGTTEPQAAQANQVGQLITGGGQLATALPEAVGAFRAARAGQAAGKMDLGAGVAQAGAAKKLKNITGRLGGAQDASAFAAKARPFLRAHLRDLEAAGPPEAVTSLRQLVGTGESLKPLTRAVRTDPAMVASFLQRTPELLPELQRAHMTELIAGATRTLGTQKGALNIAKLLRPWQKLGQAGQAAIYGAKQAQKIDRAFQAMAALVPSGEAAGKTVAAGANIGQKIATALEHGGLVAAGYELMRGKPGTAAVAAVSPFLAELLVRNGGPDWINAVVSASRDPAIWARALPALGRMGVQLLAQPPVPSTPPAAPMLFGPGLAMPPRPASSANAGLGSPGGIMAAIENTILPPGWRPGMAPVMR